MDSLKKAIRFSKKSSILKKNKKVGVSKKLEIT